MKKLFIYMLALIPMVFNACSEDFIPIDGNYVRKPVFNCVLNCNDSVQIAKLYWNVPPNEDGTASDERGEIIKDALIRIWWDDQVAFMHYGETFKDGEVDYQQVYYNDNFTPIPNKDYEVEVLLPTGQRFKSTTLTPDEIRFNTFDSRIPMVDRWGRRLENIDLSWTTGFRDYYVSARFVILYKDAKVGDQILRKIVPHKYTMVDGETVKFFPEPSYDDFISIEQSTFDLAFSEISEGDPVKSNFTIFTFMIETIIFDSNLSSYYASVKSDEEDYSIILNQRTYSNVENGLGVFGSFTMQRKAIKFENDYIEQFGYISALRPEVIWY